MSVQFFHSVRLNKEACAGCTNCVKRCPTQAIRVRDGKAKIITEKCIDCGECIRVCPHHAKRAVYDSLSILADHPYNVALPAPALYGQFRNLDDVDILLNGLLKLGFDQVFEVSEAAEVVSAATRACMEKMKKPVISSACPAVTRLIRVRFPSLIDRVLPLNAPVELAAHMAKEEAVKKTGLPESDIGLIFLTPCPAKVTAIRMPLGLDQSELTGAVAISEIYAPLAHAMNEIQRSGEPLKPLSKSGRIGVGWAIGGGEAAGTLRENYLAADGIENVIRVLEDLEDEKLGHLDFIELNACSGGCVGGVLTVENPYIARTRLKLLRRYLPVSIQHEEDARNQEGLEWNTPLDYAPVYSLDPDIGKAVEKMRLIDRLTEKLPGLDCGSCGAPTCRALAEDVVLGFARPESCIYLMKDYIRSLSRWLRDPDVEKEDIPLPEEWQVFRKEDRSEQKDDSAEGAD